MMSSQTYEAHDFTTTQKRHEGNDRYETGSNDCEASPRKMKPAIKISKRVNARLQLAAALIEADNEDVDRRHREIQEQYERDLTSQASQVDLIGPPPMPKRKLASESVIFHRYRQGGGGFVESDGLDYEGRPVIDFLGMQLPHEKRLSSSSYMSRRGDDNNDETRDWKGRPLSSRGSGPWSSRPNSISNNILVPSQSANAASMKRTFSAPSILEENKEDNLEEWGVKFLSSEAREQIETERKSRASSTFEQERPKSAQSDASVVEGEAMSETGTRASDKRASDADPSKADWLAKIRLYREGQNEGEINGEETITAESSTANLIERIGDMRSSSEDKSLNGQLRALGSMDGSSVRANSPAKEIAIDTQTGSASGEWRRSNAGIVGDSWSEEGDEMSERAASLKSAMPSPLKDDKMRLQGHKLHQEAPRAVIPLSGSQVGEDLSRHADGMTGIGSYSRTPSSRRNSLTMSSQLLQQPEPFNRARSVSPNASFASPVSPLGQSGDLGRLNGMTFLPVPGQVRSKTITTAPKRSSLLNPAFSPRLAPSTPEAKLAAIDPFPELTSVGFSRYPTMASPTINAIDSLMSMQALGSPTPFEDSKKRMRPTSMAGLSTKQLQEMAKMAVLPVAFANADDYNVDCGLPLEDAKLVETELAIFEAEEMEQNIASTLETLEAKSKKKEFPSLFSKVKEGKRSTLKGKVKAKEAILDVPAREKEKEADEQSERESPQEDIVESLPIRSEHMETFYGANEEPDLSSARWGKKRRTSTLADKIKKRLSESIANTLSSQHLNEAPEDLIMLPPSSDDVDDEYTSPPTKGPLRPRGIEARLPPAIKMPLPLKGTSLAPRKRLTVDLNQMSASRPTSFHVPDGFVLHHRLEGASTKALRVQGASATKPFFASKKEKDDNGGVVREFMKSSRSSRVIAVPVVAPTGIGRRAAMKSTALFRNQLVQHEEEKEGWGWEAGSCIGTALSKDDVEDEVDVTIQLPKNAKSRKEMKKEEKLRKVKLKRKEARRIRREKREIALSRGLTLEEAGVDEWSPEEDADLSESSSDDSRSEGEGEEGASDHSVQEEVRRRYEKKPAGTLYGKSLLDVVDERKQKVTNKARQYGQISGDTEDGDIRSIVASSIGGHSFRENPIGFNDTKERMEAAFGPDALWAKEMAKRRELDAKEEEERTAARKASEALAASIAAKKKAKEEKRSTFRLGRRSKPRQSENTESTEIPTVSIEHDQDDPRAMTDSQVPCIDVDHIEEKDEEGMPRLSSQTSHDPPKIQLTLAQKPPLSRKSSNRSGPAASWYEGQEDDDDGDDDASDDDSEREAARRNEELLRKRLSRSLGGKGMKEEIGRFFGEDDDAEEEEEEEGEPTSSSTSSSEDNVPLSNLRRTMPKSLSTSKLRLDDQESDEEEDLPLSKLVDVRKKKEQIMGSLDLDFTSHRQSKAGSNIEGDLAEDSESGYEDCDDEEDDEPIGKRVMGSQIPLQNVMTNLLRSSHDSDDDDNLPLGAAHPQAAVIAEQANMIKSLQEEIGMQQRRDRMQQSTMMMYPPPSPFGFMPPSPMAFHPGMPNPTMGMPPMMMPLAPMIAPHHQEVDNSIVNWASQVSPNDPASIPHSRDNSGD